MCSLFHLVLCFLLAAMVCCIHSLLQCIMWRRRTTWKPRSEAVFLGNCDYLQNIPMGWITTKKAGPQYFSITVYMINSKAPKCTEQKQKTPCWDYKSFFLKKKIYVRPTKDSGEPCPKVHPPVLRSISPLPPLHKSRIMPKRNVGLSVQKKEQVQDAEWKDVKLRSIMQTNRKEGVGEYSCLPWLDRHSP